MNNTESTVIANVRIITSAKGMRLFRNSVGQAWQGRITEDQNLIYPKSKRPVYVIELTDARRVTYGLVKGSSDLIGWRPLVITADMVGKTIAQFTSIECKTKAYSKITDEQANWLDQVAKSGGYAALARESKNGVEIIEWGLHNI
jgi:hypothetical protein